MGIKGELDMKLDRALKDNLPAIIGNKAGRAVIIDISGMDFIDSHGLSLLISIRRYVESNGNRFVLCSPQSYVKRILKLAGFNRLFDVYEYEYAALEALVGVPCAS